MALKMRFLYYSKKAKMKALAEAIKAEFELSQNYNAIDIIPPAYSCENERLVILATLDRNTVQCQRYALAGHTNAFVRAALIVFRRNCVASLLGKDKLIARKVPAALVADNKEITLKFIKSGGHCRAAIGNNEGIILVNGNRVAAHVGNGKSI